MNSVVFDDSFRLPGSLKLRAMQVAMTLHAEQKRKYTNTPYFEHLAEVAGLVAAVNDTYSVPDHMVAVAWLHDSIEDKGATYAQLGIAFGVDVAKGVEWLSDMEDGNRAVRKASSCARLAKAPDWVQTIKVADLISNTKSIVQHDPEFAGVYLREKQALLKVLTKANPALLAIAEQQVAQGLVTLFKPA